MTVYEEIIGNLHETPWAERLADAEIESVYLDQWTAQKSRFLTRSDQGNEVAVALRRHTEIKDGDIIEWDADKNHALVLRLALNDVLVIDLSAWAKLPAEDLLRRSVELGHAIGNQHWPAVVKGEKVYVPLTVDKKVMLGVMDTHHFEDVSYAFEQGQSVIPFMAPHEVRRLFGGASHHSHALGDEGHHHHHDHDCECNHDHD